MCLGGIFIEVLKDVQASLAPISVEEAHSMIKNLRGYKIIKGVRGQEPVNEDLFAEAVSRISCFRHALPKSRLTQSSTSRYSSACSSSMPSITLVGRVWPGLV